MPKITPFLWFDNNAEEAMNFYVSVFKNSKILRLQRFENAGPGGKGTVVTGTFELDGQQFMALQGGPLFKFTEAISMFVGRSGLLLGKADRRRKRKPMRVAERQVRIVLANRARGPRPNAG